MAPSKKKAGTPQTKPQKDVQSAEEAFIAVLGALSQEATALQDADAEDTKHQCQQWVDKIQNSGTSVPWDDVRKFAVKLITRERDFAVNRIDDFRQMIWVVIQGLRDAFRDEQMADVEMGQHLERLRGAVDSDSIDELRNEVVGAVVLINRAITDRKKRQRVQLEELGAQLNRMRTELLQAQKEMALDPMTRLYNRSSFDQLLSRTIELSLFSGQASCLMMLDVDFFKQINDRYGHLCGDQVILKVAECLQKTFPRKKDFVARYGGDEFVVILQDTELLDGEMLAKRLLGTVKEQTLTSDQGGDFSVSLSIGVSGLDKEDTPKSWVSRADQALYQAKRAGRGCVWVSRGA